MTDQEHADGIRKKAQALRDAIVVAREAGLEVVVPLLLINWLNTGHAPGEISQWVIKRRSL